MLYKSFVSLEQISKNVDEGSPIYIIYLDFHKAIEKLPADRQKITDSSKLQTLPQNNSTIFVPQMAHKVSTRERHCCR